MKYLIIKQPDDTTACFTFSEHLDHAKMADLLGSLGTVNGAAFCDVVDNKYQTRGFSHSLDMDATPEDEAELNAWLKPRREAD